MSRFLLLACFVSLLAIEASSVIEVIKGGKEIIKIIIYVMFYFSMSVPNSGRRRTRTQLPAPCMIRLACLQSSSIAFRKCRVSYSG